MKLVNQCKYVIIGAIALFAVAVQASPIDSLLHQYNDPTAGDPKGKITVVEFFDYQCSHCVDMAGVMGTLIKDNPNVRFVFKDFPIRGPMSEFAARAAIAANMQGKYYGFHHALLTTNQTLSEDQVYMLAQENGLNVDKLKKDINSQQVTNELQKNVNLAQKLKLNGTPAFFVGKTNASNIKDISFQMGSMDQSQLQALIDKSK
jgi:protein-disulfide isomerase